eukprot:362746-Chlamydomonas_euryale.AAC.2
MNPQPCAHNRRRAPTALNPARVTADAHQQPHRHVCVHAHTSPRLCAQVHINYHPDKHERMLAVVKYYVDGDQHALDAFPGGSEAGGCQGDGGGGVPLTGQAGLFQVAVSSESIAGGSPGAAVLTPT